MLSFSLPMSALADESLPPQKMHYLKIKYDDKVLFHEEIPEGKIIQITNSQGEILESEVLKKEETFELDQPKVEKGFTLSYWDIKNEDEHLQITPILTEAKEVNITFNATEGGQLIQNNAQTKVITKSVDEGTLLKELFPETNPSKHYKLSGWYTKTNNEKYEALEELDSLEVSNSTEYYALFYPDLNDNNIDDRTEKINIKLIYNMDNKSEEKSMHVGQSLKLPKPEKKDYIFIGWFYDKEFKEKYNNQVPFLDDTVLYAKWEKAEKVVKESEKKPITDKDISDQVEKYLNERLKGIEEQLSQKESSNPNKKANTKDNTAFKESKANNKPIYEDNDSKQGNIQVIQGNEENNGENEVKTYTEKKYVFKNKNIGERYMVKFFDDDNRFLFSLTLPYGRALQVLDENENVIKEYAVRQDTTINLKIKDYVNNESDFLGFDSSTIKANNSYITQVYPKINEYQPKNLSIADETLKKDDDNSKLVPIVTLVTLFLGVIAIVFYFILKRRKNKNSDVIDMKKE
ncbi:InlB B-repeat-containing protein [Niallia circulans]|uniref:InlB B-repeat-containing protein n=2 Tax=Bacillales TaxID=1385 RepID=UPI003981EEDF